MLINIDIAKGTIHSIINRDYTSSISASLATEHALITKKNWRKTRVIIIPSRLYGELFGTHPQTPIVT